MSQQAPLARIAASGLVAIVRSRQSAQLVEVAQALLQGGIDTIEITFTVPQAHKVLEQVADQLGDKILLGAGTVLDAETARTALLAGAEFLVSPAVQPDVIRLAKRYGKLVMPGAFTPTEILAAWEAGADVVKVFPCDALGPGYLKALAAPLPQVRLMPTGGVGLENAAAYLKAGAFALGVGGALVSGKTLADRDFEAITRLARQFVDVVRAART